MKRSPAAIAAVATMANVAFAQATDDRRQRQHSTEAIRSPGKSHCAFGLAAADPRIVGIARQ
jgi:hypothetical protein